MAAVNILKFGTSSPADTTPLGLLRKAGYLPSQVIALVGKTEGNGCVNDFSRTLASAVWTPLLPADAVTIFSGGTEGVLSPHVTFIVRENNQAPAHARRGLVAAATHTRALLPGEVGSAAQVEEVARAVEAAKDQIRECLRGPSGPGPGGVENEPDVQVHLAIVKCPLLTSAQIETLRAEGVEPPTSDTYESMALSRYASALGVAQALGEMSGPPVTLKEALASMAGPSSVQCSRASCSSGAELQDCHVLVLASAGVAKAQSTEAASPSVEPDSRAVIGATGSLRAVHGVMEDAIDAQAVMRLLDTVKRSGGEVVQVFAKAEADPRGHVRGRRHTMNTDSDVHSTRHARAAVGGAIGRTGSGYPGLRERGR